MARKPTEKNYSPYSQMPIAAPAESSIPSSQDCDASLLFHPHARLLRGIRSYTPDMLCIARAFPPGCNLRQIFSHLLHPSSTSALAREAFLLRARRGAF